MNVLQAVSIVTVSAVFLAGSPLLAARSQLQSYLADMPEFKKLPARGHTPSFRVKSFPPAQHAEGTDWYWIYDGEQKIGLIQTWTKEIEMFRFGPPAGDEIVAYSIPEVHHFGTLVGAKINIYAPEFGMPHEPIKVEWLKRKGASLKFKTFDKLKNGTEGVNVFELSWDPKLGYVWHGRCDYRLQKPHRLEFNNLLAGGVSETREDHKRWQKVLRGIEPGQLTWFYHNPLNVPAGKMADDGFVGFVREPDMNPFVDLQTVNTGVHLATCSQWYDQHIIAGPPEEKGKDGFYHLRAEYRFLSLPPEICRVLEKRAESINAGMGHAPGFLVGVTNDFEEPFAGDRIYNGPIWRQPFHVDDEVAHSGHKSLRVTSKHKDKPTYTSPIGGGPGVYGETGKHYRLTAWMKTDMEKGKAYVQVDDCIWNWQDVRKTRRTRSLSGKGGWTKVSAEFTPAPNDPFLVIRLTVDGKGSAWFDDIKLETLDK